MPAGSQEGQDTFFKGILHCEVCIDICAYNFCLSQKKSKLSVVKMRRHLLKCLKVYVRRNSCIEVLFDHELKQIMVVDTDAASMIMPRKQSMLHRVAFILQHQDEPYRTFLTSFWSHQSDFKKSMENFKKFRQDVNSRLNVELASHGPKRYMLDRGCIAIKVTAIEEDRFLS